LGKEIEQLAEPLPSKLAGRKPQQSVDELSVKVVQAHGAIGV